MIINKKTPDFQRTVNNKRDEWWKTNIGKRKRNGFIESENNRQKQNDNRLKTPKRRNSNKNT